jgi:hypothetical protein
MDVETATGLERIGERVDILNTSLRAEIDVLQAFAGRKSPPGH